jgi:hypothetical protein
MEKWSDIEDAFECEIDGIYYCVVYHENGDFSFTINKKVSRVKAEELGLISDICIKNRSEILVMSPPDAMLDFIWEKIGR